MHLRLENFDGPLDLLLYLIKTQELNIFNIPVAHITEQFLGFLAQVPELDYQTAGEYLATAAQLIEIKANMLIPILQNKPDPENLDEMPEEDPRKPLVEQLLEFEALKKASEFLAQAGKMQMEILPSGEFKRREDEFEQFEHPLKGNPFDLVIALERVLLRFSVQKSAPRVTVRAQKVTIQQKMVELKKRLEPLESISLKEFVEDCDSRYELIVTIMAMLELCKARHVFVRQEIEMGDIAIFKGEFFFDTSDLVIEEEISSSTHSLSSP
jgi:segregation and condensation protein A